MHITGDQDVRIDFTNHLNQITGLDLNGNGVIANDGKENALNVKPAADFVAVDAYARFDNGVLNETNLSKVFLGDIKFDGTGYKGDGVATNGNIVLGGLGADTILGGIGNDFLAGGGVAQSRVASALADWIASGRSEATFSPDALQDSLSGGRNADFFFTELSLLSNTDGNHLVIDGGTTADDTSAGTGQSTQDSDWLLLQSSDDDEPVQVVLDENGRIGLSGTTPGFGSVSTRAGQEATLKDIENVDASGNTYGFLKGLTTTVGGAPVNANNDGIGSSAQLNIQGSTANNILIGGYDNDVINGGAGNDILMGGNLNKLIDPNLVGLTGNNDGRDVLIGGAGADSIVFEADGGIIEGGSTQNQDDSDVDTLWLTANSLGAVKAAGTPVTPVTAAEMTTDGVLRFDLGVGKQGGTDNYAGYGGADAGGKGALVDGDNISIGASAGFTADQTNYIDPTHRVQVQDMENVIATGLGNIDYKAAGGNSATDVAFANQQNFQGYSGNLDLRGTTGANILYASAGNDVIEGREGNDSLSGGDGNDDFIFSLTGGTYMSTVLGSGQGEDTIRVGSGDGVDVIHRQSDANHDNLWDNYSATTGMGTFERDFGQVNNAITANSKLTLSLTDSAHPTDLTGFPVNGVVFTLDGVTYTVSLAAGVQGTYAAFNAGLNAALDANPALAALNSVLNPDNSMTITDPAGKAFVSVGYTFVNNVVPPAGTLTWNQAVGDPTSTQTQDRLIYASYFDRADGERVHDDAVTGTNISLGTDSYAQDLVINFAADGTRIAEDQSYIVKFDNLTTRDKVTIAVNGVNYSLTVGVDLDGNAIAAEDGVGDTQASIQAAFVQRLDNFINSFMDNDTAAGQVRSALTAPDSLTLQQVAYNGEQTVFMTTPVVTLVNGSNGQAPTAVVTNDAQHEVLLFNFDGRDNALNAANVLFVGDTNISRSTLETAKDAGQVLTGTNAVLVDGGVDDLAGIAVNTANNNPLLAVNFSVHGDDFLLGGKGKDTISGGTGDDRIVGSLGADVLDGGKNLYQVKVLSEAQSRVYTWNVWEAANPLLADPTLASTPFTAPVLINQNESGDALVSGLFNDTLIYQQADFDAANTRFTITLNDFNVTAGGVVELRHGGAGTAAVDVNGDGIVNGADATSTFTNFENIRTVSGTGNAVAGDGQGNDTLNVSALSTATGGISYDLTNGANQGVVAYSVNAHASLTEPAASDFESLVMKVDGVENVIGGTGDDLVMIDETEAAKNNSFSGGLGDDRIIYSNNYNAVDEALAEPTVAIKVTGVGNSTVTMTAGRVGTTVATDTLTSVEFITLNDATATGNHENDVLDVTALTSGAIVNYIDGTVRAANGTLQVTVENMYQLENVWADGNDTVIVAGSDIMGMNTRNDDTDSTASKDLTFATFLGFDTLSTTNHRVAYTSQTTAQIPNAINEGEFTFNLSKTGTGVDVDTVDYSNTIDSIAVVVELDATKDTQYVLVDAEASSSEWPFHDVSGGESDRVDRLIGVERIVASQGDSVLDLTSSTKGLEVKFEALDVANRVTALDRDVYNVKISDLTSGSPLTRSYVEYRDAGLLTATAALPDQATAIWNSVEGSDYAETIIMNSAHSTDDGTFNLRGGANEMKYNELTRSVETTISVTEYLATNALGTGKITATTTFTDGIATGSGLATLLADTGTHVVTSYTQQNGIAAGSLRIAASQDAEDVVSFTGSQDKLFILGVTGTTDNLIEVKVGNATDQNSIVLTGYEFLQDAETNDVYDMKSLSNVLGNLTLADNGTADHDLIKVYNDAADATYGGSASTISLAGLNALLTGFNFEALDVSGVTSALVTTLVGTGGTTDEVVLGAIGNIATLTDFESVVLTNVSAGSSFVLNTTTDTLTEGVKVLQDTTDSLNTVSFRGLVMENALDGGQVAKVATAITFSVAGASTDAVTVYGGTAGDTITGGAGADVLVGGQGNDTLDGGFIAAKGPIYTVTLGGGGAPTSGAAGNTMTIGGLTLTTAAAPALVTDIAAGVNVGAIGTAFAAQSLASWQAALDVSGGLTTLEAAALTSVTYDAGLQKLVFSFNTSVDSTLISAALITDPAVTGAAALFAAEVDTQAWAARGESADTYVFEATAALNGVDTLNNVDTSDTLDFSAFGPATAGSAANGATSNATWSNGFIDVLFNKASLSAVDFSGGTHMSIDDGAKVVFLVTADTTGASGTAANDAYSVYYVHDSDTTVGITPVVELVGTVHSAAELTAAQVLLMV